MCGDWSDPILEWCLQDRGANGDLKAYVTCWVWTSKGLGLPKLRVFVSGRLSVCACQLLTRVGDLSPNELESLASAQPCSQLQCTADAAIESCMETVQ